MSKSDSRENDQEFIRWAREVKARDQYTCQLCDRHGVPLHSHHINSWDAYIDQRYDIDNGITLCTRCHDLFHKTYGFGNNNEQQFEEFTLLIESFKKIIKKNKIKQRKK